MANYKGIAINTKHNIIFESEMTCNFIHSF